MKTCNKCKENKELDQFSVSKNNKDGRSWLCKSCEKLYRDSKKDIIKEYNKQWLLDNPNYHKKYYDNNLDDKRQYYKDNKECINKSMQLWYINNKESILEKKKQEYEINKTQLNFKTKEWQIMKYATDPLFRLKKNCRIYVYNSLKRNKFTKTSPSKDILGCSFEELKLHIESKFESWMNWDNQGNPKDGILECNKSWDIDHIIPVSSAKTEEELLKLLHFSNLQPLCSYINRVIKNDRLDYEK